MNSSDPKQESPESDPHSDVSREDVESALPPESEPDLSALLAEREDQLMRMAAEVENLRKRHAQELSNASKFAIESFAEALLPAADSLETALRLQDQSFEGLRSGVELTLRQLQQAFERGRLNALIRWAKSLTPTAIRRFRWWMAQAATRPSPPIMWWR
ncbi:MAG: nucleotide exchange factor GrpE [Betaproteobacteria bacterium]|nr:nucleotide exchange factor GrpE [Betaproteobacteria bacterium]